MDKYLSKSCVGVIFFPIERSPNNLTGSAFMNGYGGKSTSFSLISSLFGNVLLIHRVGPAFSAETVKYLMNVFVCVPIFLINLRG